MWAFRRAIAVNDTFVPAARLTASLIDPFSLSGNMEGVDLDVELEVNIVDFSSCAYLSWLVGPRAVIKAPSFLRWRARAKDIPLLQEIKEMIGKGKPPREGGQGHQKPCLCESQRGRNSRSPTPPVALLAPTGHAGMEAGSFEDESGIFGWFLTKFENAIKKLQEKHAQANALSSVSF